MASGRPARYRSGIARGEEESQRPDELDLTGRYVQLAIVAFGRRLDIDECFDCVGRERRDTGRGLRIEIDGRERMKKRYGGSFACTWHIDESKAARKRSIGASDTRSRLAAEMLGREKGLERARGSNPFVLGDLQPLEATGSPRSVPVSSVRLRAPGGAVARCFGGLLT